jgi:serine-type D-Ala-D-Ala carboxypeptidase (penicillin-binding protein 5/6)
MSAPSRVLAALTLSAAVLLPAQAAAGVPSQDPTPAPAPASSAAAAAPRAKAKPVVDAAEGASALPKVATKGWVLADLDTGEILAMQDPHRPLRPASTLKLLTALTVAPRLAPDQPYRAVKADEEAEGNRVVLYNGLKYTVADLLHAALLPSANDAAQALARANGGIDVTVEQMRAEAARLGASNTTVKNPSGLDADGQFTTAFDLALIGRAAFANPEIASYLTLRSAEFPGKKAAGKRVVYPIYNHNRTVYDGFEGSMGGKSGFTSQARRTYVGAAQRDGRRLMVSLLNIGGNTYTTAEVLLNWGFANADKLSPVGRLTEPSAPAPQFDRAIAALPEKGKTPVNREVAAARADDAPTAPIQPQALGQRLGLPAIPMPGLPSPLTVLTLFAAVLVVLRSRVYWIGHRSRTAWTSLDDWASTQARSARRRGPADRRVRTTHPEPATTGESLIGASQP